MSTHTTPRVKPRERQSETTQELQLTIPDSLQPNALSRRVFHNRPEETALELLDAKTETLTYILPWGSASGKIAGYEQDAGTFAVRPVELSHEELRELFDTHVPREVDLLDTPAWLLDARPRDGERVSWHARVRYAQRVEPMADPAGAIRESYARAGYVSTDHYERAMYDPADDLMFLLHPDEAQFDIATVFPPDCCDFETQHWRDCHDCRTSFDPSRHDNCPHCREARQ